VIRTTTISLPSKTDQPRSCAISEGVDTDQDSDQDSDPDMYHDLDNDP